jgi:wyosine [tRNA(Phe)-imidazoG37] synthetase (radical SAM superfamily)
MQAGYQTLFGPVPSRRFGRSLGVDLTPYKTCCYDCVFCQLGRTTRKTVERREYVKTTAVLSELKHWYRTGGRADVVTLSGSGEPTLHLRFGEVLTFIREEIGIPAVLLTNGALLFLSEVRDAAACADIVKVSLSAWHQPSFEWVNRPDDSLMFDQMIQGQKRFRAQFNGRLWMEVFLVKGMNSFSGVVKEIAALAREIAPDRIQLNTAVRPPAEDFVSPVTKEQMEALTLIFQPPAEIIAEYNIVDSGHEQIQVNEEKIFAMLQRRPCTAEQIADGFDMHLNEVLKYLAMLIRTGKIRAESAKQAVYYVASG